MVITETNYYDLLINKKMTIQSVLPLPQNLDTQLDYLEGTIEHVTFHAEDTGFCVLKIKSKSHKTLIPLVGSFPVVMAGGWVEAHGQWVHDRRFGQQFKASRLEIKEPTAIESIEKYLSSGLIKGVGPSTAKKLTQKFGKKVFDIIENNPELLSKVPGLTQRVIDKILESWEDQKAIHKIMLFLHNHEISPARAARIYKLYGDQAITIIAHDPYRLARDIKGIGFLSADKVAEKIGIPKDSLIRARAGIHYALSKGVDEGHCGLPLEELLKSSEKLLSIDKTRLVEALGEELETGFLIKDFINDLECIFPRYLYHAEKGIVRRLKKLMGAPLPFNDFDVFDAIERVEDLTEVSLSTSQQDALEMALTNKVSIITGGPGVGKTTILQTLVKILSDKKLSLSLCAPTGRAAKRMSEATGSEALTIHRLLNINPVTGAFAYDDMEPMKCDVLIVDEVSMVDVLLMDALLKAVPTNAQLIFVGDKDQLPSVGPGQVLADLITSGVIPCYHLTEIFRQAASSNIIQIAKAINQGDMPTLTGLGASSDFFFFEVSEPDDALEQIIDIVKNRLPNRLGFSPIHCIQVLSPMNRGVVGVKNLNVELQKALNPPNQNSLHKFGSVYGVGDKVLQIENNYQKEVYNGDIGTIKNIDSDSSSVIITFDGRDVIYDISEMEEISLAYALTIHKAQGSEYPVVIIPLMTQHYPMLKKNLVYTGITRGKKMVILIGQKKAIGIAVSDHHLSHRWSLLESRLRMELG